MMTITDERALELVLRQSFGQPKQYGPNAPTTIPRLLSSFIRLERADMQRSTKCLLLA
jgi:IclR family acetate operon transcriptional repressor